MRKNKSYTFEWKKSLFFLLIGMILFASAAYTQSSLNKTLSEGIYISSNKINYEGSALAPLFLSNSYGTESKELKVNGITQYKRVLEYDTVPDKVGMYLSWENSFDSISSFSNSVVLIVNNHSMDISNDISALRPDNKELLVLDLKEHLREGTNEITIKLDDSGSAGQSVVLYTEGIFKAEPRSYEYRDSEWIPLSSELLIFSYEQNPLWFKMLFRLGFIFKIIGFIFLFIAIFGIDEAREVLKKPRTTVFVVLYSSFIMWLITALDSFWYVFSTIVAKGTFVLLKLSGLNPAFRMDGNLPGVGVPSFFVFITKDCSGIESSIFYVLFYTVILIMFWGDLKPLRTALLFPVGLVGVFLVNILRVYMIEMLGIFVSPSFAINTFHANIGFFLSTIYMFLLFYFALPFIRKSK